MENGKWRIKTDACFLEPHAHEGRLKSSRPNNEKTNL